MKSPTKNQIRNSCTAWVMPNNVNLASINSYTTNTISSQVLTNNSTQKHTLEIGGKDITSGKFIFDDREIDIKHIITAGDLENKATFEDIYKVLFLKLCSIYKDQSDKYNALLKIYNFNYRDTVLSIEMLRLKNSTKDLLTIIGDNNG